MLQPRESADLPDTGAIEWAPVAPYWSVLWRSGLALAREVARAPLAGRRVVELGCGLGAASIAAARSGAQVLATDADPEALELVRRSAAMNGVSVATARAEWEDPADLFRHGRFDLVLAADLLYDPAKVDQLLEILPRLGSEAWLADPGREDAEMFLERARREWSIETSTTGEVQIHRLVDTRG